MEQSSYQRHCINFYRLSRDNLKLIFVNRVLEATLPSLRHVNQYDLLLLLLLFTMKV